MVARKELKLDRLKSHITCQYVYFANGVWSYTATILVTSIIRIIISLSNTKHFNKAKKSSNLSLPKPPQFDGVLRKRFAPGEQNLWLFTFRAGVHIVL